MSRASDLRKAVAAQVGDHFPGYTVDQFWRPRWNREDLETAPRIAVRIGGRELSLNQGPDEAEVTIEIGVVGLLSPTGSTDGTEEGFASETVDKCDEYDGLLESIIGLWTNRGPLSRKGVAGHYVVAISQAIQFDPQQLDKGVYLSMIQVTYRDSEDE